MEDRHVPSVNPETVPDLMEFIPQPAEVDDQSAVARAQNQTLRMAELAEEIADCLREIAQIQGEGTDNIRSGVGGKIKQLIDKAEAVYRRRRKREKVFADETLFGEPGWDMLLDLFSSYLKGRDISVTSACLAANVPATTALRWISVLEEAGLVQRAKDPSDARRSYLRLTPNAVSKLTEVLTQTL